MKQLCGVIAAAIIYIIIFGHFEKTKDGWTLSWPSVFETYYSKYPQK